MRRRLSPREAARLQGFPDTFDFGPQSDAATYKQLGNGVNVGVVCNVFRALAHRDAEILMTTREGAAILRAIVSAPQALDAPVLAAIAAGQHRLRGTQLPLAM
ncbi:DNA cytosine methyltransferase [Salana multivorans]